jgi:hypothetical protein
VETYEVVAGCNGFKLIEDVGITPNVAIHAHLRHLHSITTRSSQLSKHQEFHA